MVDFSRLKQASWPFPVGSKLVQRSWESNPDDILERDAILVVRKLADAAAFSGDKCTAFYSTEFTEANKRIGQISFRLERYQYGSMTDCHSYDSGKLITHILSGPKEVRRSGFGKWISSQEHRDIEDEQKHV